MLTAHKQAVRDGLLFPEVSAGNSVRMESLPPFFVPRHALVTESFYVDRSDEHAEVAWTRTRQLHSVEKRLQLEGVLVAFDDPATGEGLVWARLAPTTAVRSWDTAPSLILEYEAGVWRATPGVTGLAYEQVLLRYRGGEIGRTRALQSWQRGRHPRREGRDGLLLSNTWGDRSRADRLNEAFVMAEIDRAAELGVEVVQLDDGWQKGKTANTVESGGVWNGFWAEAADYWTPDPERFPQGLEPLARHAVKRGVRLGLWYAPDSSDECSNWQKDARLLTSLWRRHGITHFKLDAVKLLSTQCERRFRALLDYVQEESEGSILCDLDTTAEARLGFWGRPEGTTIFVENRYTDWATYYPHATLRALWSLAWTVHPPRLRMEFLNPARHDDLYDGDPLRPARYRADYLFASVMVASPLAWFENTGLAPRFVADVAPLIALWKRHRAELHGGDILPIGERPDGHAWTGFVFVGADDAARHVLVFRETTSRTEATLALPQGVTAPARWERLAGTGVARAVPGGVCVTLPDQRSFSWLRAERR